ncbi:mCG144510, partial [Mus musculus]
GGGGAAAAAAAATTGVARNGRRPAALSMRAAPHMLSNRTRLSSQPHPLRRGSLRLRAVDVQGLSGAKATSNPLLRVLRAARGRAWTGLGKLSVEAVFSESGGMLLLAGGDFCNS